MGAAFGSSVAFRLSLIPTDDAATPAGVSPRAAATELVAAPGLVARLAGGEIPFGLAKGLPARLGMPVFGFGTLGLVARLATTEWPPWPGTGEVARDCDGDSVFTGIVLCPFTAGLPPNGVPGDV